MSVAAEFDAPAPDPAGPPEWLSLSDYAARRGVNKSTISRQVGTAIPPSATRRERGGRLMIRVADADLALSRNLDPAQQRRPTPPLFAAAAPSEAPPAAADWGYASARARKEHYLAEKAARDDMAARGLLLDKADAYSAFVAVAATLRQELEARRHLLSVDLAGIADPGEIAARLEAADDRALRRLVDEFQRLSGLAVAAAADPPRPVGDA